MSLRVNKAMLTVVSSLMVVTLLSESVLAMCIWFAPPSRTFEPAENMRVLVARDGVETKMVVQPEFSGTATDFALVMPFPNEPTIEEAPENIFVDLEDLTNPIEQVDVSVGLDSASGVAESRQAENQVRVVERKEVGDFSTVTLEADDSTALVEWLQENGYNIEDEKIEILENYIDEGGFFVALKVNIDEADVDADGNIDGALRPIEFSFDASDAMLPLRLMENNEGDIMSLTVYTLGDRLHFVPGAEIQFSRKVTGEDIDEFSTLEQYDAQRNWLVRNTFEFDPTKVKADLEIESTAQEVVVDVDDESVVLNPDSLDPDTGVIISDQGDITYLEPDPLLGDAVASPANSTLWLITIVLAISNLVLLGVISTKNHNEKVAREQEKEDK